MRGRENGFPRVRVGVSPSPFKRGHPATPRRRLTPVVASASGHGHRSGAHAPIPAPAFRCGRRRLVSCAHGRLWRFVAQAQPFARLLLVAGSSRNSGVLAALSPAPTPPSTHGLSPALRSRTYAANPPARIGRCSRWLARLRLRYALRSSAARLPVLNPDAPLFVARPLSGHPRFSPLLPQNRHPGPSPKLRPFSRCRAPSRDFLPAKPHPDGCLILAPATAGGVRRKRLRRPRLKVLLGFACAPPCATVLIVGIPPGRPI
jgi:hypothetical protein